MQELLGIVIPILALYIAVSLVFFWNNEQKLTKLTSLILILYFLMFLLLVSAS